ncbi:MAG: type II toxin-antitoxin system VapB family antitoxin [Acidimicrobiaceae bacterium]|nr:type II toxin-antitoxin system VapB family antitoxin [Acidimicrobiaceae bacterium]MXZ97462.1 type II toxin-antitoxin system VapB family antitoxin [Acidimicrobiaceae bacterium]MYE75019.1 type II toxin-antitoxin system VapB family antitoxin [Acidimicrobiaceae bacterium]MYE96669.1 type II toxin-antitoxin system VapB family antitoxin [Acidimicrobiaceae bacterium]MYI52755.1 type II toxin-antitoxin system VapB family antitoxin [Acidimicrobiaceae bacterium]
MTKRLIDIDDDLLEEVRSLIGASTMKEAVNGALRHVVDFELRLQHVRRLLTLEGTDLADEQIMRDTWR